MLSEHFIILQSGVYFKGFSEEKEKCSQKRDYTAPRKVGRKPRFLPFLVKYYVNYSREGN